MGTRRSGRHLTSARLLVVAVALVLGSHLLGTPRNAGPDEASHQVASAALVRGERDGEPVRKSRTVVTFNVPSMAGTPNPGCFAFQPEVPVSCNNGVALRTDTAAMGTTSQHYPPLGLLLPGLASYVPWAGGYAYLARLLAASVPSVLVVAALLRVRRSGGLATLGVVVGLTPIAWSTMSITNPSGLAIAGGLALWVAGTTPHEVEHPDSHRGDWLLAAGWIALAASRRDGPLWATVVVLAVSSTTLVPVTSGWARLHRGQQVAVVAGWLATLAAVRTDTGSPFPFLMALAPLALPVVGAVGPRVATTWRSGFAARVMVLGAAALAGTMGTALLLVASDRISATYLTRVVGSTGEHLVQVVGRLGTLDASAPTSVVIAWWLVVGLLLGLAVVHSPRTVATVLALLVGAIVLAWLLEIGSGNRSGSYWQARYSLPLLIGLPFAAARVVPALPTASRRLVSGLLGVTSWWVANATFAVALRRWSVGITGPLSPFAWDTWHAPLPPVAVLAAHAIGTGLLVGWAVRASDSPADT